MAYFSNGTEGEMFYSRECRGCVHEATEDEGCAIYDAHLLWNYDQIVDGEREGPLASVLTYLINDKKPLGKWCKMRKDK